jgi:hypothetical protein
MLRRRVLFGYLMGGLLMGVAGVFLLFVTPARDGLWTMVFWAGAALAACALVVPDALAWPDRAWTALAQAMGRVVFAGMLIGVYFAVVTPLGFLRRLLHGTRPFAWWVASPPADAEGWTEKRLPLDTAIAPARRRGIARQALGVVLFLGRRRQWLLLPALILLLVLGMTLFFVQGSVLAPLVYTIF